MTSAPTVTLTTGAPIPPVATLVATAPPNIVGFRRAAKTPFDDTISRYMDATQVLMCQLMDEVVRDLLGEVSHYGIPESSSCDEFYAWLENAASKTLDTNLATFSSVLASIGMGDSPDNMKPQTDALRASIVGVLRAAFDPVCTGGSALTKDAIMKRMKELQGFLCATKSDGGAGGPWPKFVTDPVTGAQSIVSKDGTRINLNLDNSADNTNNLANMVQESSGKLDPNVLAALLLANNRPPPPPVVLPVDPGAPEEPVEEAPTADVDTALILGQLASAPPTAAPVSTIFGLGPLGFAMVLGLIVFIVVCVWVLRKPSDAGGAPAAPRNVPVGFAEAAPPRW